MRQAILAGAALLAVSTAVGAASPPGRTKAQLPPILPHVEKDHHWTSFYFGAHGGHVWGDTKFVALPSGRDSLSPAGLINFDYQGWLAGFQSGYRHQFDTRFVAGWEVDLSYVGQDGIGRHDNGPFGGYFGNELDWMGTFRGRIGYSFNRFMPYATGGIATSGSKTHAKEVFGQGDAASDHKTSIGWVAGIGAEYALTEHLTWKAEYLRAEFGKSMPQMRHPATDGTFITTDRNSVDSLRFGLNLKIQ